MVKNMTQINFYDLLISKGHKTYIVSYCISFINSTMHKFFP